ncbi:thioesterase family protein [Oceanobacter kriegii]|uniref:thioesterase family protein n=1 Tax=Oceanobacter kriegii TaxID=64972 RepID=UPI00055F4301|nr:thioesterase family protein [Oceanobacter kriegii]
MATTHLLPLIQTQVAPQWVDYNRHMNDACYVVVFSQAIDALIDHLGLDASYREQHDVSVYTLQSMVHYLQEITEGEPLTVVAQLLDSDNKKLRVFFQMLHTSSGDLLAEFETLLLHMDMKTHRPAPFDNVIAEQVKALQKRHESFPKPDRAGRGIAMRKPA